MRFCGGTCYSLVLADAPLVVARFSMHEPLTHTLRVEFQVWQLAFDLTKRQWLKTREAWRTLAAKDRVICFDDSAVGVDVLARLGFEEQRKGRWLWR